MNWILGCLGGLCLVSSIALDGKKGKFVIGLGIALIVLGAIISL
ncbi:hypothetical protein [Vibrio sonorensis]|nr:hypothetical protein [Vibrio sonorensis]